MEKLKSYKDWEIENLANLTALPFPSPPAGGRAREGAEVTISLFHLFTS